MFYIRPFCALVSVTASHGSRLAHPDAVCDCVSVVPARGWRVLVFLRLFETGEQNV